MFNNRTTWLAAALGLGLVLLVLPWFSRAEAAEPRPGEDRYQQGEAALDKNEYDLAIQCSTEAIRTDPECADVYRHRARAYLQKDEPQKAIADLNETIRIIEAVKDPRERDPAVVALGHIGDPHAVGPLEEALKNEAAAKELRDRVTKALARIKGEGRSPRGWRDGKGTVPVP